MDQDELLTSVRARRAAPGGIGLASWYVAAVGPCLAADGCRQQFFGLGTPAQWAHEIKAAAGRLVWRDQDMRLDGGVILGEAPRQLIPDKALAPLASVKAVMEFTGVATSARKDHDADVLEPAGCEPDPAHPLLWQHLALAPVGRHLQLLEKSATRVRSHWAIADVPLGHDAAKLVEFGALRLSIGFIPLDFQPLAKSGWQGETTDPRQGWHVKRYKWVETSLVSVPSNEDAVITAFSREQLEHPLTKAWAESLYKSLPPVERSGWAPVAAGDAAGTAPASCSCRHKQEPPANPEPPTAKPYSGEHSCRLSDPARFARFRRQNRKVKGGKTIGFIFGQMKGSDGWELQAMRFPTGDWTAAEAKSHCGKQDGKFEAAAKAPGGSPCAGHFIPAEQLAGSGEPEVKQAGVVLGQRRGVPLPHLDGSWEHLQARLEDGLRQHMKAHGKNGYGHAVLGTFDDHCVVASGTNDVGYGDTPKYQVHKVPWEMTADGPNWSGAPEPVDLVVTAEDGRPKSQADVDGLVEKALDWGVRGDGKPGKRQRLVNKLTQAEALAGHVKRADELAHPTRASAEKLHVLVLDSLQDAKTFGGRPLEGQAPASQDDVSSQVVTPTTAAEYLGRKLLGELLLKQAPAPGTLALLEDALAAHREREVTEILAELLG